MLDCVCVIDPYIKGKNCTWLQMRSSLPSTTAPLDGTWRQWFTQMTALIFHPFHIFLSHYEPFDEPHSCCFWSNKLTNSTLRLLPDPYACVFLCTWAVEVIWVRRWKRERARLLCLRFAGTGRGFAWKEKDTLEHSMVIIRRDKRRRKKDRGTKDLPGLSLHTGPLFFQWLMAHKWKQTLKEKMKTSLRFRPSALPRDPAQTPLCCQTTVELAKRSS